jgi:tryptophan-rich sensory protein
MSRPLALLLWILLCFTAAAGGGFVMTGDWYAMLSKPTWNPPSWVFGPVWTLLYIMMGVSAWLVWKEGGFAQQRKPLTLFLVQLVLNAIWTPLFFGAHELGIAFAEILLLWLAILATILAFRRVSTTAAWLLVPYLLWVSFASVLNATLWWMN